MASLPIKGPMPPFRVFSAFLEEAERQRLLDWTLANEARFEASRLAGRVLDQSRRVSQVLRDLGPMADPIEARVRAALPDVFAATGTKPFEIGCVELELAAHGDGAHFARHTDLPLGPGRIAVGGDGTGTFDRLLSGVYYFYQEPKRFSGGALRLHRFGSTDAEGDHLDIQPDQNSFVVFPAWATHEVRTVHVTSASFDASRFAVNCWICRAAR